MRKALSAVLQIGYWLIYIASLLLIFLLVNVQRHDNVTTPNFLSWIKLMLLTGILPGATAFYAAYLVAFRRFLQTRQFFLLAVFAIGVSLLSSLIIAVLISITISPAFWVEDGIQGASIVIAILSIISLLNFSIGLVIKGFISWYNDLHLKEELNKRNYEMELNLIKSQLDPHFLFNTINNIDVLIENDNKKASLYLNKLSDIMRFMLYETKTNKIPLSKELAYVEKYIDLQKIRTLRPDTIQFRIDSTDDSWMIEPMLFIPFIENAFKHFTPNENAFIKIHFAIQRNAIRFRCVNSVEINMQKEKSTAGLGKDLIERRLTLLHPGLFELETKSEEKIYSVNLSLFR